MPQRSRYIALTNQLQITEVEFGYMKYIDCSKECAEVFKDGQVYEEWKDYVLGIGLDGKSIAIPIKEEESQDDDEIYFELFNILTDGLLPSKMRIERAKSKFHITRKQ